MNTINLREWNISYDELVKWSVERDADVYALIHHGGNGVSATYAFTNDEDFTAFKLTFDPEKNRSRDFFDTGNPETNYF